MEKNSSVYWYKSADQTNVLDGISYPAGDLWKGAGVTVALDDLNIRAKHLYLLGGNYSQGKPHPDWGGGHAEKNFFVGNRVAEIVLTYADGTKDVVPLIYGHTTLSGMGYRGVPDPFRSDDSAMKGRDEPLKRFASGGSKWA